MRICHGQKEKFWIPTKVQRREETEIPLALTQSISQQDTERLSIKPVPVVSFLTSSAYISEKQKSFGKAKLDQYRREGL